MEKIELQLRGSLKIIELCGSPSIWGSQADMFQQKYFRSNVSFSDPGETSVMEENLYTKIEKKSVFYNFS